MKKLSVLILVLFSAVSLHAQQAITGNWNTGKDNTTIEITEVDGVCKGKIISSDNAKAPVGKLLLRDVKLVDGVWKGQLFAAKKKKWMDAVLAAEGEQLLVTVKAGMMSKKLKWKKE